MIRLYEIAGRQSGKTHRIIERMLDGEDLVYVGADLLQVEWAFNHAMDILEQRGATWDDSVVRRFRERFMTWEQAADPRMHGKVRHPVAIDNADHVLQSIFGHVDTVTMTTPPHISIIEGNHHV